MSLHRIFFLLLFSLLSWIQLSFTGAFTGWGKSLNQCKSLVLELFLSPFYQLSFAASTSSLVGLGWKVLVVSTVILRSVLPDLGQRVTHIGWLCDVIRVSMTSSSVHSIGCRCSSSFASRKIPHHRHPPYRWRGFCSRVDRSCRCGRSTRFVSSWWGSCSRRRWCSRWLLTV